MPSYKPLNYREVTKVLKKLGFTPRPRKATSHESWIKTYKGKNYVVTVAHHGKNTQFPPKTLKSMIEQSGYTKEEFYKHL